MFSKLSQSIIYRKGLYGFNLLKTGILVVCVLAGEDAVTTCVSPRQTAGRPGPRLESGTWKLKAANLGGGDRFTHVGAKIHFYRVSHK